MEKEVVSDLRTISSGRKDGYPQCYEARRKELGKNDFVAGCQQAMIKLRHICVPLNQVLWIRGQPCEILSRRSILHNGGANTLVKVKWARHLIEEIAVTQLEEMIL